VGVTMVRLYRDRTTEGEATVMGNLIAKLEISNRYCTVGKGR
jgi:hypothetical protein